MATTQQRTDLAALEAADEFVGRHIGPQGDDIDHMLGVVGAASLDELISQTVPASIRVDEPLDLPAAVGEAEVIARLRDLAARNRVMHSLIGLGYHGTATPPVVLRNIIENPAWYTSYTPYQPEISQGRLQALLNFQTLVSDLTGLPLANASLLDEGTAAAEAMTMARRAGKSDSPVFFVDSDCHPQTIAVVATRAEPVGVELVVGDPATDMPAQVFGALLASPGSSGQVRDLAPSSTACTTPAAWPWWWPTRCRCCWSRRPAPWAPTSKRTTGDRRFGFVAGSNCRASATRCPSPAHR